MVFVSFLFCFVCFVEDFLVCNLLCFALFLFVYVLFLFCLLFIYFFVHSNSYRTFIVFNITLAWRTKILKGTKHSQHYINITKKNYERDLELTALHYYHMTKTAKIMNWMRLEKRHHNLEVYRQKQTLHKQMPSKWPKLKQTKEKNHK